MKVMVIGSGGREHALCWKLSQSPKVESVLCLPGNEGTRMTAKCRNLDIKNIDEQVDTAVRTKTDLALIGPEVPLVEGIADKMRTAGIPTVGPGKVAARLEGSKAAAKDFMVRHGVRTAGYRRFHREERDSAEDYLRSAEYPLVIKADGLAAGKGVTICGSEDEALQTVKMLFEEDILEGSGHTVVVEQYLQGKEVSVLSLCDGKRIVPLISAMDHKRIGDGDTGPNTGGMGAVAPNPYFTDALKDDFEKAILRPTLQGLRNEELDYRGIIFFGIMLHQDRNYLLEYNVRFGDPETQAVLPLLDEDLAELLEEVAEGSLKRETLRYHEGAACNVVMASGGYPGKYPTGRVIRFSTLVSSEDDSPRSTRTSMFIAGAQRQDGRLVTSGGRVLSVTGIGVNPDDARRQAYEGVRQVDFQDKYYRRDIGFC